MLPEVPGEFEERGIFLAHAIEHTNGASLCARQTDDLAARSAQFPLKWMHLLHWRMKVPLEKLFQYVHEPSFVNPRYGQINWCFFIIVDSRRMQLGLTRMMSFTSILAQSQQSMKPLRRTYPPDIDGLAAIWALLWPDLSLRLYPQLYFKNASEPQKSRWHRAQTDRAAKPSFQKFRSYVREGNRALNESRRS